MDGQSALLLFAAGLAGGVVTAVVGGASLITFPALLAAGLPPVVANASNTVALTPGNLVAALADLERRPRWDRSFLALSLVAVAGSAGGAALLLATPERAFTTLVPLLVGFATILFALAERIRPWMTSRAAGRGSPGSPGSLTLLLFAPVAVYGGYFGAGMSVIILALLSASLPADFRAVNVLKNLLSGLTSLVAVIVFGVQGVVAWAPALAMMGGTLVGGFLGGRLVRVLPSRVVRVAVIAVGTILTSVYAWRYWLRA
jgi:uncharacterized membrane protein YfcA